MDSVRRALIWSIVVAGNLYVEAQSVPILSLSASPTTEILLTKVNIGDVPGLERVFDISPAVKELQSSCFALSNQSERAVIGVGLQWTIVDSFGQKSTRPFESHSYLAPDFAPLARPHERLIIMPGMFIQESILKSRGLIVSSPGRRIIALFRSAAEIHVEIDSIIFGDGEIIGPNALQLHAEIQARKDAAEIIVEQVHASAAALLRKSGQIDADPETFKRRVHEFVKHIDGQLPKDHQIASDLQMLTERPSNDAVSKHAAGFARSLLQTQHFRGLFEFIEASPSVPKFYRKDGQKL